MIDLSFLTIPASLVMLTISLAWLLIILLSLLYKPPSLSSPHNNNPLLFSVIIPAHNEEKVIKDIIQDFLNQTYPNLEIIVVCHNCVDRTYEVASSIKDERLKVIELRTPISGKALALNEALKHCRGDVVVQMDADNRVGKDFLSKASFYFADPSLNAIQVKLSTKNPNFNLLTKCQQLEYEMFGMPFWEGRSVLGLSCTIGGTGVMIRREILESVGGWDNELIEDYDLYCKLTQKGIKVIYAPDVECYDEKPPYWSALISQRARWIKGHFHIMGKRFHDRFSLLDILYMFSPMFYIAWYLSALITFLYPLSFLLHFSISFFYVHAYIWFCSLLIMYAFFAFRLWKQRMPADILYLPIFFLFSFHWLIAFLKSFFIKTWAQAKTAHGYITT